jgi:hypothetical protein
VLNFFAEDVDDQVVCDGIFVMRLLS